MLTKQKIEKLMKIEGESRGANIKIDLDLVLDERGKKGLEKVEKRAKELGISLKREDIKSMDFYPVGLDIVTMLIIKEIFNLNDKDLVKFGSSDVKFSLFIKIFMKYFGSLKLIASQIPRMWQEHYSIGELEMFKYNKEKRYAILRLRNFCVNPLFCKTQRGYFAKFAEMVIKNKVTSKETKCMFKGDKYHEYLLTW